MVFGPFRHVLRAIVIVVLFTAATLGGARADESRRAGTVRLETSSGARGGRGPLDLKADKDGYSAELVIVNDGKEPLVVSRLAVRGDASDPRVPPKLLARLSDGSLPITLAPGTSRKALVSWIPDRGVKQRQLFGHVVVTTSDEHSGEVTMGVRAQMPGPLGPFESHVLSLLVGIPLLGALATLLLRGAGRRDDRTSHGLTGLALGLQTLLAGYVYRGFVPDVSRVSGNDGLQFVEHVVWIRGLAAELYLGVDGIGATSLFVTSLVLFLAVLPERTIPRGAVGYHAALLVLDAAVIGAQAAMDGLLFILFSTVAVVAAGLLVGTWGGPARRAAAMRLVVPGIFATLLVALAIFSTTRHADPTFLVDGTKVTTTTSLPELSRVALGVKGATFLGASLSKVAFVMVLVASMFFLAAFPAHGWLSDVLVEAPPVTGIVVATALPTMGLAAFLRIGCAVFPDGMRWASGVVVALGAISTAYGALLALGQRDLRRMAAAATTCQSGFVLLGAGSLTPQGLSGSIVLGGSRALACGLFLVLVSAIHDRSRTCDVSRFEGVATPMPRWGFAFAAAGLAQAGVLGLGGAWGPALSLLGALSSYAPLAIVAAIALVVVAAAHLSALSKVAFRPLDPEWEKNELLEPFGGKFPDLTSREWMSVVPLTVLVVILGLWPAPIISVTTGTVRDLANAVSPPGPDQVAVR